MIALLIVLQIGLVVALAIMLRSRSISPVLSTSLLLFSSLWYIIPVILGIPFWEDLSSFVDYPTFIRSAVIETLTLLCTLVVLLRLPRFQWRGITANPAAEFNPGPITAAVLIGAGIALDFYVEYAFGSVLGDSYLQRNAFFVTADGSAELGIIGSLNFVQILLTSFGYACLFRNWPVGLHNRMIAVLVSVWTGVSIVHSLRQGSRFGIVLPLVLVLISGRVARWPLSKLMRRVGILAGSTIVAASVLLVVVAQFRSTRVMASGAEIVSSSAEFLDGSRSSSDLGHALVREVATKLDSFSVGAFLLERMGPHYAGWQPYVGSLLSVVPRRLLSSKPVPGSVDGTYSGHPSRVMAAAMGMDSAAGNVDVSAAAVTIWQLGYLGLPLMVAANVLYLSFINALLLSESVLLNSVGVFAMSIPTFLTLFASPDVVILNAERLVTMFLVVSAICQLLAGVVRRGRAAKRALTVARVRVGTTSQEVTLRASL